MQFSTSSIILLITKIVALTLVLLLVAGLGSRLIPAQAPELINDNVTAASEAAQPSGSFLVLILGVLFAQTPPSPIRSCVPAISDHFLLKIRVYRGKLN
jgi:hypothetical protein